MDSFPPLKMIAVSLAILLSLFCEASTVVVLLNSTESSPPTNNFTDTEAALRAPLQSAEIPKARRKRYISQNDMIAILDYHNQVRGKVFPPAANMEYMVRGHPSSLNSEWESFNCVVVGYQWTAVPICQGIQGTYLNLGKVLMYLVMLNGVLSWIDVCEIDRGGDLHRLYFCEFHNPKKPHFL